MGGEGKRVGYGGENWKDGKDGRLEERMGGRKGNENRERDSKEKRREGRRGERKVVGMENVSPTF
jgi:hypothetical protein